MTNDCCQFVGLVADTLVMADGNPSSRAHDSQPFVIRTIRREMLCVTLYIETRCGQYVREAISQVSIGEVDKSQAARS